MVRIGSILRLPKNPKTKKKKKTLYLAARPPSVRHPSRRSASLAESCCGCHFRSHWGEEEWEGKRFASPDLVAVAIFEVISEWKGEYCFLEKGKDTTFSSISRNPNGCVSILHLSIAVSSQSWSLDQSTDCERLQVCNHGIIQSNFSLFFGHLNSLILSLVSA